MAEGNKSGDLFSSGKQVAESATSVFQHKSEEVAGAAAEILHTASSYAKLEDKPGGQYVKKAEVYLKEFSTGPAAGAEKPAGDAPAAAPAAAGDDAPKPEEPAAEAPKEPAPPAPAAEESKSEGFGLDDVVKGAEELVEKKGEGEDQSGSGGGAGGLFKMAQGFLK